jgi:hypothetical protein
VINVIEVGAPTNVNSRRAPPNIKEAKTMENREITVEFLNGLYSGIEDKKDDLHLVLTTAVTPFKEPKNYWFKFNEMESMIDRSIIASESGLNVFFNICLQDQAAAFKLKGSQYTRGEEDTVAALPGFWVDIDIKGPNHSATNLPETMDEAIELLEAASLPPSIIVSTGGGIHGYWVLNSPLLIDNDIERQRAKRISSNIQLMIRKKAQEKGWTIDNTSDLVRLFRLPGTVNSKNEPKLVEIIQINGNRYELADFEALLPNTNNKQRPVNNSESDVKPQIEPIVEGCAFMRHTKEDAATLPEPEWYAMMSITANCENGIELTHSLSEPHPKYSPEETDKKIEQALSNAGPRTCDNIDEMTAGLYCNDCMSRGKIKSPIVLGNQRHKVTSIEALKVTEAALQAVVNGHPGAHLTPEAIAAFSVLQRTNLPQFARIKVELKNAGAPVAELNRALKIVQTNNVSTAQDRNSDNISTIGDIMPDAPMPNIRVPGDYRLRNNGLYRIFVGENDEINEVLIAHNPVIITGKYKDIDEHNEIVSLAWKRNGRWQTSYAERGVVADARKILQLADMGFPVHSLNAGDLVKFLAEMEALNETVICTIPNSE